MAKNSFENALTIKTFMINTTNHSKTVYFNIMESLETIRENDHGQTGSIYFHFLKHVKVILKYDNFRVSFSHHN